MDSDATAVLMDPLPFSAGIAGLLSLTIEITKLTYEYVSGIKDAPKVAQSLLTETTAIENILRDLRNKVLLNPDVSAVFKSASMDHSARVQLFNQCESDLSSLLKELERKSASAPIIRGLRRLRWPFKKGYARQAHPFVMVLILASHSCEP